ncbi:MAG: L-seryl-tRNA(Sec) selenium transferase [Fimbriimonadaceae bacterium]|nr:L-seryl-tRNA(Sec) selenium transferase [Fimbriimonadaceae bacterium]
MSDLRRLPSVDRIKRSDALSGFSDPVRTAAARQSIEEARANGGFAEQEILNRAGAVANQLATPSLRGVINLSGIILHTGLGRARLAKAASDAISEVAQAHASVEFDMESGTRGDRQVHVRELIRGLTGAEDAFVVNNCAAAVVLSLSALCAGREVLLSRGQMVEIGGAFRMPDIVRQSGCNLVEVGCTNRTRLSDYDGAIGPDLGAILRCHPSNFKIVGFAEEVPLRDLASLTHRHDSILIDDAGSGCLLDTTRFGLPAEPRLQDAIRDGVDLVLCSGDKLLGGPQAGLIIGRKSLIEAIRKHPLARAVRIDKLTLAGLEATLRLYRDGRELEVPVWQTISRPVEEVRRTAKSFVRHCPEGTSVVASETEIGGGSLPGATVPTFAIRIPTANPIETLKALRRHRVPVIGRVEDGAVLLDPRTASPEELPEVRRALAALPT